MMSNAFEELTGWSNEEIAEMLLEEEFGEDLEDYRRYHNMFNIGQIVRIDAASHKYIIHIGFGKLMFFYISNPRIKVGDFIVFDYLKNNEVEYIDELSNYQYVDNFETYPYENNEEIDKTKIPPKCICKNKSFSSYVYGGKSYVILDSNCHTNESGVRRLMPSFETHLLLNSLYSDNNKLILEESRFTEALKWASEIVEQYNFEDALKSVRVFTKSFSKGVCHDHNGEYLTNVYYEMEYLHHNNRSSYFECHSVQDPYLEKVIFPELDIHLSFTDDRNPERDWINPNYPNPNNWDEEAKVLEQKIRSAAESKYNKIEHISALAYSKIEKELELFKKEEQIRKINKTIADICWGLYIFEGENFIDDDVLKKYYRLSNHYKNTCDNNTIIDIKSDELSEFVKKIYPISEKLRKTIISFLGVDFK